MRPTQNRTVPTVLIEEHHEAFYVWNYSVQAGWLSSEPRTLLHVDEHADMAIPRLHRQIESISGLQDLAAFTYQELNINNFIWAAAYQGCLSRIWWMRANHAESAGGWRRMRIEPKNQEATEFVITAASSANSHPESRTIEYAPLTTRDRVDSQSLILDIDLDYFCWNERAEPPEWQIEVTESAYKKFQADKYHYLRIAPGGRVSLVKSNGSYYITLDQYPKPANKPIEKEVIQNRLREFQNFLTRNGVQPELIVLCRSIHSGYLPKQHAVFVEESLVNLLKELYPLRMQHIESLLPAMDS